MSLTVGDSVLGIGVGGQARGRRESVTAFPARGDNSKVESKFTHGPSTPRSGARPRRPGDGGRRPRQGGINQSQYYFGHFSVADWELPASVAPPARGEFGR